MLIKYKKISFALFMLIFCFSAKAQIKLEVNTRTAKVDTCFDYFLGVGIADSIFHKFEITAFGSFERDRGTNYLSYKGGISNQYFKISHITDTEKDIEVSSCNVYYSMDTKGLATRIGADISYSDKILYGAYLALKYQSLKIDAAFNAKLYNFSCSYNPKIQISERTTIGGIMRGFYIEDKFKFRTGATLTIKL